MSYVVEEEEDILPPVREEDARRTLPLTQYYKKQKQSERYESIRKQSRSFERTLRHEELEKKRKRICFTYEGTRYCDKKRCIQDLVIRGVLGRGSYGEVHFATVRGNPSTK